MGERLNERMAKPFPLHRNQRLLGILRGINALQGLGAEGNQRLNEISRHRVFRRLRHAEINDDDGQNVAARLHRNVPVA